MRLKPRLTLKAWQKIAPQVKDISHELPDAFLMFGQWMRAKIEVKGKKYFTNGWQDPNGTAWVDITAE